MCFIAYTAFKKTACGNFADSFYFIISSIITSSIRSTLSCFFGVSLSSFPSNRRSVKKMLTFANAAASLITTRKGALRVMPEKGEVEAVIK